ncbi:ComEC/Rec2 family competence protein, partial [Planktotalea sp.]|uniref:ComEC/Rec2 family competence protein n=1 Tax=Planktotalea sp. TaxID=2029877 RepID=UPI0025FDDDF3
NLAHLLAISGLHMGLLAGFVFTALRLGLILIPSIAAGGLAKKLAAFGGLIAAAGYLGLSGGSIATERAFVMAAVTVGAVILERRAISLRAVALAALIILVRRPEAITGPGFQMSFAATTALVVVFTIMNRRNAGKAPRNPIVSISVGTLISSAVAGFATLPIAAAHFNMISHYGLLANLISVPLMGVLVIPMAVVAVCLLPLHLEWIPLMLMGYGLDWILGVADAVSHWPDAVSKVPAPPDWAFFSLCLGLLWMALMMSKVRLVGLLPVCIALLVWAQVQRPDVLISDTGSLVGVLRDGGRALSKEKGSGFVASVWLENDGDAIFQKRAAGRWEGGRTINAGGHSVHAASGKRGLAGFKGCNRKDIVVFSEAYKGDATCEIFDRNRLRETGSISITFDENGIADITTARAMAGRQYWDTKALRKARFGH